MQFLRYLLVGGFNTLFGLAVAELLVLLLSKPFPRYGYIATPVLSNLINVTVAYLGYKWFVFKTHGHYWREWLKAMAVYSVPMLVNTAALPALTSLLQHAAHLGTKAPYIAVALLTGLTVIYSFIGNKRFTFKRAAESSPPGGTGSGEPAPAEPTSR